MALVLGANLGSAINGAEGCPGGERRRHRAAVALGNLINRAIGCIVALPLLGLIGPSLVEFQPNLSRALADFHTVFNLAVAAVFLPLLGRGAALLTACCPSTSTRTIPAGRSTSTPTPWRRRRSRSAMPAARRCGWPRCMAEMIRGAEEALTGDDRSRVSATKRMSGTLERLGTAIKAYLVRIDPDALSEADERPGGGRCSLRDQPRTRRRHPVAQRDGAGREAAEARPRLPRRTARPSSGTCCSRLATNLNTAGAVFMTVDRAPPGSSRR